MIPVQKAVIKKDDKYLIVLRSPDAHVFPNCWDFPGGKLEPGENPVEGIKREVIEETTLEIKPIEIIAVYDVKLKDGREPQISLYSIEWFKGDVKLSDEHTDFKWATKEEILELDTEPYLPHFVKGEMKCRIDV